MKKLMMFLTICSMSGVILCPPKGKKPDKDDVLLAAAMAQVAQEKATGVKPKEGPRQLRHESTTDGQRTGNVKSVSDEVAVALRDGNPIAFSGKHMAPHDYRKAGDLPLKIRGGNAQTI